MRYCGIVLLLLSGVLTFAQERATGLDRDDKSFTDLVVFPYPVSGLGGSKLSSNRDLSPFAPHVKHQGEISSSVAWATAYAAYGIQLAQKRFYEDKSEITRMTYNPLYIYRQLKGNGECRGGIKLDEVARYLISNGGLLFDQFSDTNCSAIVTKEQENRARSQRANAILYAVFKVDDEEELKIFRVKSQIDLYKSPVVVGMRIRSNFYNLNSTKSYYIPDASDLESDVNYHALCVIGYSDSRSAFKIMNSWGPSWGIDGYFWMKYVDFGRESFAAITMVLD